MMCKEPKVKRFEGLEPIGCLRELKAQDHHRSKKKNELE